MLHDAIRTRRKEWRSIYNCQTSYSFNLYHEDYCRRQAAWLNYVIFNKYMKKGIIKAWRWFFHVLCDGRKAWNCKCWNATTYKSWQDKLQKRMMMTMMIFWWCLRTCKMHAESQNLLTNRHLYTLCIHSSFSRDSLRPREKNCGQSFYALAPKQHEDENGEEEERFSKSDSNLSWIRIALPCIIHILYLPAADLQFVASSQTAYKDEAFLELFSPPYTRWLCSVRTTNNNRRIHTHKGTDSLG